MSRLSEIERKKDLKTRKAMEVIRKYKITIANDILFSSSFLCFLTNFHVSNMILADNLGGITPAFS